MSSPGAREVAGGSDPAGAPLEEVRLSHVHALARSGATSAPELLSMLAAGTWVIRRAIVAELSAMGESVVPILCQTLATDRTNEARLSGIVDALCETKVEVDSSVMALIDRGEPAVIADAAHILGRRRAEHAVEVLSLLTRHEDDNVAVAAIEALGRIGTSAAVDPLLVLLSGKDFFRTFPAIDVLGRSNDARAVEPLSALVANSTYAAEAARALGRLGGERAAAALAELLSRPGEALVRVAASALLELHQRAFALYRTAKPVEEAVERVARRTPLGRQLSGALAAADLDERRALLAIMGWLGVEDTASVLVRHLDDPELRGVALDALRRIGPSAHGPLVQAVAGGSSLQRRLLLPLLSGRTPLPVLAACLADEDATVRSLAALGIAATADTAAVPILFSHLSETDRRASTAIIAAIQALGSNDTEHLTLRAAESNDPFERRAGLRLIGYFGYLRGLPSVLSALAGDDDKLRELAVQSLPFIDDERALEALIAASRHPSNATRAAAVRALGDAPRGARTTASLVRALDDPFAWVRYYACQALGKLAEESATDAIVARMHDEAGQVRIAVIDALSHLRNPIATETLRAAADAVDVDLRRSALLALGISKQVASLPILIRGLDAPDPATRLVALAALAEFNGPEVLVALTRAMSDPDRSVSEAAIGFVGARPGLDATRALLTVLGTSGAHDVVLDALSIPVEGRVETLGASLSEAKVALLPLLSAALVRIGGDAAISVLTKALRSESVDLRRAAAHALSATARGELRGLLRQASATDADAEVRRICAAAWLR